MADFTPQDIEAAVAAGLISNEDAATLMESLQPEGMPWGAIAGGALGAVAGGAAGYKGGGKLGSILSGSAEKAAPGLMQDMAAGASRTRTMPMPGGKPGVDFNLAELGTGAAGLGAGGVGGAMMGGMMDGPPEMGDYEQGGDAMGQAAEGLSDEDRTMALQALTDPNVPPQVKKEILAALQAYDAAEGGGEEEGGFPWGAVGGGLAGAGLGALVGPAGRKMAGMDPGMMQSAGKFMDDAPIAKLGGSMLGAGGGAMLGDFAQAAMTPSPGQQRRYEDPMGG